MSRFKYIVRPVTIRLTEFLAAWYVSPPMTKRPFGKALAAARDKHDPWLSQEAVARMANLSVRTVARIESGEGPEPELETILVLARLFPEELASYFPSVEEKP